MKAATFKYGLSVVAIAFPALTWAQATGSAPLPPISASAGLLASGQVKLTLPELQDRLVLTVQQQLLWTGFESRVDAYVGLYYRERPVQPSLDLAATQQLAQWLGQQQNRLAALEDVEVAAKALYASLDPAQQQVANQFLLGTIPGFSPVISGLSTAQEQRCKPGAGPGRGRGMGSGV